MGKKLWPDFPSNGDLGPRTDGRTDGPSDNLSTHAVFPAVFQFCWPFREFKDVSGKMDSVGQDDHFEVSFVFSNFC